MNKEDIIFLAKQAGFERLGHDEHDYVCYPDDIAAFAELIAKHERKKCVEVIKDNWIYTANPSEMVYYILERGQA